jgi:hypothetical protein
MKSVPVLQMGQQRPVVNVIKTFYLPLTVGQNKVECFSLTSPAMGRLYKIFMGVIIVF